MKISYELIEEIYNQDMMKILEDSVGSRKSKKRKRKRIKHNEMYDHLLKHPIILDPTDVLFPVKKSSRFTPKKPRQSANLDDKREERREPLVLISQLNLKQAKISRYIPSLSPSSQDGTFTKLHNKRKPRSAKISHNSPHNPPAKLNLITNYTTAITSHKLSPETSAPSPLITLPPNSHPEDPGPGDDHS